MHFAIIQNWGLGDLVMTTPVITEFRRLFPDARLTLIVHGKPQAALMKGSPMVDQILEMPPPSDQRGTLKFFRDLRHQQVDIAFIGTRIGGVLPWFVKVVAGVPVLLGDGRREKYPFIYKVRNKVDPTQHRVDRMLATFALWSHQPPGPPRFPIPRNENAMEEARSILSANGLQAGRFIVVHPGSSGGSGGSDKRIPIDVARRVSDDILEASPDMSLVFIFGPDDVDLIGGFRELGERKVVLSGNPLPTTIALISQAAGFIGTDSALGHIAAAFDVPTATLFGPTIPSETAPYGTGATIITRPQKLECQPCWGTALYGHCPYGARCMHELPESTIVQEAITWAARDSFG